MKISPRHLRFCLSSLLVVLISTASYSQAENVLSLQECIKIALDNNLNVRRGLYNVETFKVNLLQSKMAFLPTANIGSSYGQNYGRALNPVTNLFINRDNTTINVQGTSSLSLFNGLRIQNTFRQNQRDFSASEKDLEKAKNIWEEESKKEVYISYYLEKKENFFQKE